MHFELLHESHTHRLLHFENQNRAYFERFISPRETSFYSESGVICHINALTNSESATAFLLIEGERIVARANIKNLIHNEHAEIGYRVGQNDTGKGVASACVQFLIKQAVQFNLKYLSAYVMDNNRASEKVLIRNGFHLALCLPNKFTHQGKCLHGYKYLRNFQSFF